MKVDIREENLVRKQIRKKFSNSQIINMIVVKKEVKNNRFVLR
jgi:hypothetical protein|tara:strand:- start:118 stop:246 length:129 start_codon:yes stop_codon:yes gene_type:complete